MLYITAAPESLPGLLSYLALLINCAHSLPAKLPKPDFGTFFCLSSDMSDKPFSFGATVQFSVCRSGFGQDTPTCFAYLESGMTIR
jgi:hypothetical protein